MQILVYGRPEPYGVTYINVHDNKYLSFLKAYEVQFESNIDQNGKILNADNQYLKKYSGMFMWLQMFLRPRKCIVGLKIHLN